ncbi:MAG: hypothetical protein Q7J16_00550 [Candidatus Cloacimonadales bacterium]|nr:hypothetical protein [Candidatus Cloacimonadales bacterium]
MRCPKESFIKGEIFHIYHRSIESFLLFKEDEDHEWFMDRFQKKMIIYPTSVFAYCLMPNHFHFLLRQDSEKPVYRIFNDSLSSYVRHYNFKYKHRGILLDGHLQHVNVKSNQYAAYLCQYIHYNPKKAGLVNDPVDWKHSNYLEWIGLRNSKPFTEKMLYDYFEDSNQYRHEMKEHEKYVKEKSFSKLLIDN